MKMTKQEIIDLTLLAALWGGSFLFMRVAAPAFGPLALVEVRVGVAAIMLLSVLLWQRRGGELRQRTFQFGLIGVLGSAIPCVLLSYATLTLTAGLTSLLNATTPMWTALVAWLWLREQIRGVQWLGLVMGLVGVAVLVSDRVDQHLDASAWTALLAVAACLLATLSYGISANFTKRYLTGVAPLTIATGSLCGAAVILMPLALMSWPAQNPDVYAWSSALLLAVFCTAIAYLLYFRLMARLGPMGAASVTFLIPLFASLWGAVFLHEAVTTHMLIGGVVILAGTALALGLVGAKR